MVCNSRLATELKSNPLEVLTNLDNLLLSNAIKTRAIINVNDFLDTPAIHAPVPKRPLPPPPKTPVIPPNTPMAVESPQAAD